MVVPGTTREGLQHARRNRVICARMVKCFLPAVLSRIELPSKPPPVQESRLARPVLAAPRYRALIITGFLVIVVVAAFYIPRLDVVSNQLMFFREGSEIRNTFSKVEEHFGGALPLTAEIVANRGVDTLRDYNFAEEILDIERELERMPGIKSAFSIFDMVGNINWISYRWYN